MRACLLIAAVLTAVCSSPNVIQAKKKWERLRLQAAGVIRVGRQPKQIGVRPDGRKAYVTNFGGKSITVLDLVKFKVHKTLHTGGAPVELDFTPNGQYVYITNFDKVTQDGPRAGAWKIDTKRDKIVARIKGHRYPKGVVVSRDGKRVYFSSWWWPKGYMVVADVKINRIIKRLRVWNRPRGMSLSPDGKWLYMCNFGDKSRKGMGLAIINTRTWKRKYMIYSGYLPRHVVRSPSGHRIYVSNLGASTITTINPKSGRILKRTRLATGPKTLDITSDGRYVFVAHYFGRALAVMDTRTYKRVAYIKLGDRLSGLDVSPDDKYVYVTGWDTYKTWRFKIVRDQVDFNPYPTQKRRRWKKRKRRKKRRRARKRKKQHRARKS